MPLDNNMPRTLRQPGFWLAAGLVGLGMALQMLLAAPLELIDVVLRSQKSTPLELVRDPLAIGLLNIAALGAVITIGLLVNRLSPRRAFPLGNIRPLGWIALGLIGVGGGILLSEADNFVRWLIPPPDWIVELVGDLFLAQGRPLSLFFTLVIVAPLTEELLFRGLILRGLLGRFSSWWALVISAGLFSVMHLNPWQAVPTFALGLIFGWFYLRTGSLMPCIAGHALNNFMSLVMMLGAFGLWEPMATADFAVVEFQPWWLTLLGALLFATGGGLFHRATTHSAVDWDEPRPPRETRPPLPPTLPPPIR